MTAPLLSVRDLRTEIHAESGPVTVVDGVSFDVARGEVFGLMGESGCGKSMTALSIMDLLPGPRGRVAGGSILFEGRDLATLAPAARKALAGNRIAMIFQETMTALNPVYRVGVQIAEPLRQHRKLTRKQARNTAIELLARVGIADPARRVDDFPHQMSGGMRQRVMIATALSCDPALLIADEPTTALDVTVQAQIIDLILDLQRETGMGVIMITHDPGVIAAMADRVAIMYAGVIVETGAAPGVFERPRHPYTLGLMRSIPSPVGGPDRLEAIPGTVLAPAARGAGCRFANRCLFVLERCEDEEPALEEVAPGHRSRCFNHRRLAAVTGLAGASR